MCGIAGVLYFQNKKVIPPILQKMADALAHRGPDGEGFYINTNQNIGLAHRRLSVIDLSSAGNQPMHYLNRYTIIHNGEIYNYIELKKDLEKNGLIFKTATDTEVIVAAYHYYQEKCVHYFDGMFAFVIWDEVEKILFAARDRFGEKPFYYFQNEEQFYFASEMKGLWAGGIPKEINHSLMCLYLGAGYTSIPLEPDFTFYKNIFSLAPAHYLTIDTKLATKHPISLQSYWDIDKESVTTISENEAVEQFTHLFKTSIERRLRSDIPIGTSLSGGLDSSSIAAFLNQLNKNNYQTFSAVFPGFQKDESKYIDIVNQQFSIKGTSTTPSINDFIQDFEKIITTQEQPFISSSIYAQYKVMETAKQHNVTVLLDGQGADETLAGYSKYIHWYLQELFLFNKKMYREELKKLQSNTNFSWGLLNKMAAWFPAPAATRLEKNVVNQIKWKNYLQQDYFAANFSRLFIYKPLTKKLNDLLYHNTMQFGLQELLSYADKNAMAHGVEVRLPFLSHELVQFIFSLPSYFKIKNGFQKNILRQAVNGKLDDAITWRKDKIGYETPQQEWLQNEFFVQKIKTAKQQLVATQILNKNVLTAKTTTEQNWRIIIAAEYL